MSAEEIVQACLYETGTRDISKHSQEIALISLVHLPLADLGRRQYRQRIKSTFLRGHPEASSVFIMLVLPILVSVISAWITRWILNRKDMRTIQGQAFDALSELSPSTTATLTSISIPRKKPTEPA